MQWQYSSWVPIPTCSKLYYSLLELPGQKDDPDAGSQFGGQQWICVKLDAESKWNLICSHQFPRQIDPEMGQAPCKTVLKQSDILQNRSSDPSPNIWCHTLRLVNNARYQPDRMLPDAPLTQHSFHTETRNQFSRTCSHYIVNKTTLHDVHNM